MAQPMFPLMPVLMLALASAACTNDPGFTGVSDVREATAAEVAQCAYVIDIRMRPGVYGPLASEGLRYARNTVLADARAAGANTVVFQQATPGADVYLVTAKAYRC